MPEAPLTDREIRVLRGMIDEYSFRVSRRRMFVSVASDVRTTVAVVGALSLLVLNVVTVILLLSAK